ncbi:fungal-specific transcription factor domain-containing protein [Daedaleopsis nitida]|nr:fungal-specific transcription factor domain-containing protein [Daedaleopsis nitida]
MPAETSKAAIAAAAARRRNNNLRRDTDDVKFDSSHAREIELKRSRGEISCAECRRLKIRCDKTIPCQSCQRRGCAALCPNGSLATGQGTRFVLAATEHLHRRIAKMSDRIHQLEDALAILQAKSSNDPHPLLSEGSSKLANMDEDEDIHPIEQVSGDVVTAFGMLSMSDRGISRFFGPTGGTEYLLFTDSEDPSSPSTGSRSPESLRDSKTPPLPGEVTRFSNAFPFTPMGSTHHVYELIEGHLPTYQRACELTESYITRAGWLFRSVPRKQLFEEMIPHFYKQAPGEDVPLPSTDYSSPHDLALLLLCFAIGALVDLKQQPYNSEADHYCQLAQAAMCLQPVLSNPTLVTIQALHLQSIYVAMVGNEPGGQDNHMEFSWALITLAGQLSHTIGLHRDSARFGFPPDIVERRRVTFWDLFVADAWQSLMTGRPPVISREYIDCKFPTPSAPQDEDDGEEREAAFETWGFRFALTCVAEVAAKTLTAEAPSYETIMELDMKVREFPIPPDAAAFQEDLETPPDSEPPPLQDSMIRFVLSHSREVILLFLHRSFFAQSIIDCPRNPLRSAYAPSFLAAYRSSSTILKVVRDQFALFPEMCARFWVIWTFAFSSAVVFATVVTRGPRSAMAQQALIQLDQAYELFTQASKHSRRAAKALPILLRLREKAHCAFAAAQKDPAGNTLYDGSLWNMNGDTDGDELDIFAGRTTVVASKRPSPSPAQPVPQHGEPVPLITPPTAIPIAPIPSNEVSLTDVWPVHRSAPNGQSPSPFSAGPSPTTHCPMHATPTHPHPHPSQPQHPYRLSFSQPPPQPRQPQAGPSGYQHGWIGQHSPTTMTPPGYGAPISPISPAHYSPQPPPPSFASGATADMLQRYANAAAYQSPHHSQHAHAQHSHPQHAQQHAHTHSHSHQPPPQPQSYAPPSELVDLGLASRHGRLDERWTSFMHENGFL